MTDDHRLLTADCRLPTILVTGGCGFIGTNLVKYLTERGHKVRILDNLSTSSTMWTADRRPSTADCRLGGGRHSRQGDGRKGSDGY